MARRRRLRPRPRSLTLGQKSAGAVAATVQDARSGPRRRRRRCCEAGLLRPTTSRQRAPCLSAWMDSWPSPSPSLQGHVGARASHLFLCARRRQIFLSVAPSSRRRSACCSSLHRARGLSLQNGANLMLVRGHSRQPALSRRTSDDGLRGSSLRLSLATQMRRVAAAGVCLATALWRHP